MIKELHNSIVQGPAIVPGLTSVAWVIPDRLNVGNVIVPVAARNVCPILINGESNLEHTVDTVAAWHAGGCQHLLGSVSKCVGPSRGHPERSLSVL